MSEDKFDFEALATVMNKFLEGWVAEMTEVILPAVEKVMDAVHEGYIEQGAIYGDTTPGMLRWMRELSEANKYLIRAAYIQQRHQMLREFKEKLGE